MKRFILFVWFCLITASTWAQWSTTALSQVRSDIGTAALGQKVYFAGGELLNGMVSNVIDIYDASNNTWTTATLPIGRQNIAVASAGGKLFFAGGFDEVNVTNRVDIWDPTTNTWTVANLSQARTEMVAVSVGNKVLFVGGTGQAVGESNAVDIFDVLSQTWSATTIPLARHALTAEVVGNKAYFIGGGNSSGWVSSIDVYDASSNSWSVITMPTGRSSHASAVLGSKIFIAGGTASGPTFLSSVDIFDTSTSTWTTANMSRGRAMFSAESVGPNVFFFGGTYDASNIVDVFDNSTGTWSTTTLSSENRLGAAAITIGVDVFFAGGNLVGGAPYKTNTVDKFHLDITTRVDSFTPATGVVGDVVTISGFFDPTPANNTVKFNGINAVVTSSTYSTITAIVPPSASSGLITVTANGFTGTSQTAFTVTGSTAQTITFPTITTKTYGNAPFALTATASSGLPVTYSSSNPAVATVSGSTVTIVGAGTCTITASQAGNATYRAAPDVARTLTVNKATQTITFPAIGGKTYTSPDFTISATSSSGLPVTVTNSNPAVVDFVSANTLHVYSVGSSNLTASQPGDNNYLAATNIVRTVTVAKATQTITFPAPPIRTYDQVSYQFTATSSSGLPITYTSSNPAVATIGGPNGNIATFTGVGTSTITANQPGDANYNAATAVARTLTVNKGVQTITFGALSSVNSYDPDFNLSGTASSGLPVAYTSSNTSVATVSDPDADNIWTVHIVGPGTTNITASQAGNTLWNAATNVVQALFVKTPQTITFGALATKVVGDPPFNLTGTASSGLTITYTSSNTSVATVSGNTVTILAPGSTVITASQAGNATFSPATPVAQTLLVNVPAPTAPPSFIEFTSVTSTSMNIGFLPGNGNRHIVVIKPTDPSNYFVPAINQVYNPGFTSNGSTVVASGTATSVAVTGLSPSTKYYVKVFTFNQTGSSTAYLTTLEANAAQTTTATGGGGARMANVTAPVANPEPAPVAKPAQDYTRREFNVKISGNPFEDRLIFSVDSELSDASVALYDAAGRLVHQSTVPTNTTVEIAKPMNPGVYILRVQSGMDTKAVQVIKVK